MGQREDRGLPDPWAVLAARPELTLIWADMPRGMRAATDGQRIYLARGLSQRERRSALMHELLHVDAGHAGHQSPAVERAIEVATARALLPDLRVVAHAIAATATLDEAAGELWVTEAVLAARLPDLARHPGARHILTWPPT